MRPHPRWRRLFDRIARLFLRAVPPARPPAADEPSGALVGRRRAAAAREADRAADGRDSPSGATGGAGPGESPLFGDFTGQDEAQRFAGLPPIGAEALEGVDWDELARELTGPR